MNKTGGWIVTGTYDEQNWDLNANFQKVRVRASFVISDTIILSLNCIFTNNFVFSLVVLLPSPGLMVG